MPNETLSGNDIQSAAAREQVRLALRHLPVMQLASFIVALLLAYSVRRIVPFENIAAWILMVLFIVTGRIIYYVRFTRVRNEQFNGAVWKNVYILMVFVSGVVWGLSSVLVFPVGDPGLTSLFLLMIAGLSAATTVSHSALRFAPAAWMCPVLLPFAIRCLIEGGESDYVMGILSIVYLVALIGLSLNNHATITSSILHRFENLKLLGEVRQSAERFRLLFLRHNAVMLLLDPGTGAIVDANAAAVRFYGYPEGKLQSLNISDINLLPPEDVRIKRMLAMSEESNYSLFPQRLANGDVRMVEIHSSPIETKDRVLLFSIIHDITERKKAEEQLRASEEGYRNLFNSINDAIYIVDENGRLLDMNKGAEMMYGRARVDMLGKTPDILAAPGAAAAIGKALEGEPQLIEFSSSRSDGTAFPQEVRFVPATYGGGTRVVIAVARDISERKRIEGEQLRTQKIEAIGVLAGGIAHDFNNLLQAVLGFLAVAKRKVDQHDRVLLMIEKAENALQMSVKLTTQLVTFSKGGKPVKKSIALAPVIESATRFALSGSRSDCRFDVSSDLWPADADEGQITQVVQNIVINADQAMPDGGIISVSARNRERGDAPASGFPGPGRWIEIVVRDTGCGISESDLPRIFEPYFTTKQTGSGLGLATSYSIVKNHGGMIEVSSQVNKGSAFTLWLPAGGPVADSAVRSEPPASIRRGRILIMDDEEVVRDSVGAMLDTLGQEVEFTADGAAAVHRYRTARSAGFPFDVVILDATVRGGMGGEEAILRLKEIDPSVVAVVSSGYSDKAMVSNYSQYGFRAFLPKPFSLESLQTVLSGLLRG